MIVQKPRVITISISTIFNILGVIVVLYLLYLIRDVLAIFFMALILAAVISPWVDWVNQKGVPKWLGVVSVYIVILFLLGTVAYLILIPVREQFHELSQNSPYYFDKVSSFFKVLEDYTGKNFLTEIKSGNLNFSSNSQNFYTTLSGILRGILSFFVTFVIAFYMLVEENALKKILWSFVPKKNHFYITDIISRMQNKIGRWIRGQLILSLIIFSIIFFSLSVLGVKYALILAFVAGLFEFIPYLGPILAFLPAIFLSFVQSPTLAILVVLVYAITQWMENNIIVPKVMQKVIGFNPIVSVLVLLTGFKIGGPVGAIVAMPVATATSVLVQDLFERKELEDKKNKKNYK